MMNKIRIYFILIIVLAVLPVSAIGGVYAFYPEKVTKEIATLKTSADEIKMQTNILVSYVGNTVAGAIESVQNIGDTAVNIMSEKFAFLYTVDNKSFNHDNNIPELSVKDIKIIEAPSNKMAFDNGERDMPNLDFITDIEPASGGDNETLNLNTEAVLVPKEKTVISSSRDGKIKKIYFENGDVFKKGDIILEYDCLSVRAEVDAAVAQNRFAREKTLITDKLYNLELVSKLERLESQFEQKKASAGKAVTESKYGDCVIRADYDGRVIKKLANENEYTRTDRVLMEVASMEKLDAEFLLPSISLQWLNVNAPISLTLHETGSVYSGKISRIYGEVDPVSQSIQMRAELNPYQHSLLPGMSGQLDVDFDQVKKSGVKGFLDIEGK